MAARPVGEEGSREFCWRNCRCRPIKKLKRSVKKQCTFGHKLSMDWTETESGREPNDSLFNFTEFANFTSKIPHDAFRIERIRSSSAQSQFHIGGTFVSVGDIVLVCVVVVNLFIL